MFRGKISESSLHDFLLSLTIAVLAIIVVTGLGAIVLTIFFGVPIGDDYLAIKMFSNKHTWLATSLQSLAETGRYAQSIASSVSYGLFRDKVGVFLPAIAVLWTLTLTYLFTTLLVRRSHIPATRTHSSLFAATLLYLMVASGRVTDPNGVWYIFQPFFFSSAIVTYTLSVLLYFTLFYLVIRNWNFIQAHRRGSLVAFALLTFVFALFNETTPATLAGLSSMMLLYSYMPSKLHAPNLTPLRPYFFTLIASSVVALLTMFFSPANIARRHKTGALQNTDIITPIARKLEFALTSVVYRPSDVILLIALGVIVGFVVFRITSKRKLPTIKLFIAGVLLLISSLLSLIASITLTTIGYGPSISLLPRTLLLPQIFYITGLVILSMSLFLAMLNYSSGRIQSFIVSIALLGTTVALVISLPHHISRTAGQVSGVQDYHAVWLKQDSRLKSASKIDPNSTIYISDQGAGIGDGFSIKCYAESSKYTSWLNDGMEAYYSVKEICSESEVMQGSQR